MGYVHIWPVEVMKIVRVLVTNMTLIWDKRGDGASLYWTEELGKCSESESTIPVISSNMKIMVKYLIQLLSKDLVSCDFLSMINPVSSVFALISMYFIRIDLSPYC